MRVALEHVRSFESLFLPDPQISFSYSQYQDEANVVSLDTLEARLDPTRYELRSCTLSELVVRVSRRAQKALAGAVAGWTFSPVIFGDSKKKLARSISVLKFSV